MENQIIYQKIKHGVNSEYVLAEKYYDILSVINDLNLTKREIQLVAYVAVNNDVPYSVLREEFCEKYGSTAPTINNIVSKLRKKFVLKKEKDKVDVNPVIFLNFKKNLKLEINFEHNETK